MKALWLLGCLVSGVALAADAGVAAAPAVSLQALADEYLDQFFLPEQPTEATQLGVHRYDDQLEDYTLAGVTRRVARLQSFEQRLRTIDPAGLSQWQAGDRAVLLANVQSSLLTLQQIRPLQQQPDVYATGITSAAYVLMERQFDTPTARLQKIVERERRMPAVLQTARVNLRNPPRIHTQVALDQIPGDISFFENDLPEAFAAVTDPQVLASFRASNAAVIAALRDYEQWLRKDLLPRSKGDFRLGARVFSAKLKYDEMVDMPLPQLLKIGMANLRRNQQEFARVARQLDPGKTTRQVLAELGADHPPPSELLNTFRTTFDGLIRFIKDKEIIDLPDGPQPTLQETPPFMRATTFASMDTPGPFETRATEAYFNVTLPAADLDAAQTDDYMAQFSYPVINSVTIHEAYPGHYVQFLWEHRVDDRVRQVLGANTNIEGWAHYCEQMILDEGYAEVGVGAKDERQALRLRLGQLQDALLRNARYIAGIRMHTGGMSFDQAVDFFVREGYQSRSVARVEATRGASDPTYLYYTLGKLQIQKLRADLQAREGAAFKLKQFHDNLMLQGFVPIRIARQALLGDDSPTL